MLKYRPPKELRALFIVHYSPLLLIILLGPLTAIYNIWMIPTNQITTISTGLIRLLHFKSVGASGELFDTRVMFAESCVNPFDVAVIVAVPSVTPAVYVTVAIPPDACTVVAFMLPPALPLKENVIVVFVGTR